MIEDGYNDTLEIIKQDNKYLGKFIGNGEPFDEQGNPKKDRKNPDKKLRNRPLMGIIGLTDLIYDENNIWDDGKMYYPKDGKTYSCKIILKNKNTIEARYYWGFSLLGYSEEWKRIK